MEDFNNAIAFFVEGRWASHKTQDQRRLLRQACTSGRLRNWLTIEAKFASSELSAGAGRGVLEQNPCDWIARLQALLVVVAGDPLFQLNCSESDGKQTLAGVSITLSHSRGSDCLMISCLLRVGRRVGVVGKRCESSIAHVLWRSHS